MFTSQYDFFYTTSHWKIVPGCPVLGSFGASLLTRAPIHRFTPFGWHHDVHDFHGTQPHVFFCRAFTEHGLALFTSTVYFKHGAYLDVVIGDNVRFRE